MKVLVAGKTNLWSFTETAVRDIKEAFGALKGGNEVLVFVVFPKVA